MSEMLVVERKQVDIDRVLDHTEQQQEGLMTTLEIYEKIAEESFDAQSGGTQGIGHRSCRYRTRQKVSGFGKSYLTVRSFELHVRRGPLHPPGQPLRPANLNDRSCKRPLDCPGLPKMPTMGRREVRLGWVKILSSRLESLQWIDGSVRELESNVTEVEKRVRKAGLGVEKWVRWTCQWEVDDVDSRAARDRPR